MSFKVNSDKSNDVAQTKNKVEENVQSAPSNKKAKKTKRPGTVKKFVTGLAGSETRNIQRPSDIRKQALADIQEKFSDENEDEDKYKSVVNPKLYLYLFIAALVFVILMLVMMLINR